MKKLLWLILLFFPALALADKPLLVEVDDFSGGIDTAHLAEKIKANSSRHAVNMQTYQKRGLSRREGYKFEASSMTGSTTGLWRFVAVNNDEWLVRLDSSGFMMAGRSIGSSSASLTTPVTTYRFSITQLTDADVGLGKIWFSNLSDGLSSWDGTDFTLYPSAPKAARICIYKNRVVLGNVSNAQSRVAMSGELNGSDFVTDSRFSTSPITFPIGGVNDGNKVYDVFPALGELLVFKQFSLWRILGNDQRDFRTELINPSIGTVYPNATAQRAEATIFLSNRGIDAYIPPYSITKISDDVQDLVEPLAALGANSRSHIITSQIDWNGGISSPTANISTVLSTGDIIPANLTQIDTDGSGWTLGTFNNGSKGGSVIDTSSVNGSMIYRSSVIFGFLPNTSFETAGANSSVAANWMFSPSSGDINIGLINFYSHGVQRFNGLAKDGSWSVQFVYWPALIDGAVAAATGTLILMDVSSNTITELSIADFVNNNQNVYQWNPLDTSLGFGTTAYVKIRFHGRDSVRGFYDYPDFIMSQTPIYISSSVSLWIQRDDSLGAAIYYVDYINQGQQRDYIDRVASFHSRVFDTRISSPNFGPFNATIVNSTITWTLETSTASNCCWDAPVSVTTDAVPAISRKQYVIYNATFTAPPTSQITLNDVTLRSWVTGYHQTSFFDAGTDATSWGLFTANAFPNGGTITYRLQSSTDGILGSSWTVQPTDVGILVPVRRYIAAQIEFQSSASTHTPTVSDITYNWDEGESPPVPNGIVYKDSYYLFYSTSTGADSKADSSLVYNPDNAFNEFGGIYAGAAVVYGNKLTFGDSNNSGKIFAMDLSTDGTDASVSVASRIEFRRMDGGDPDAVKIFDKMFFTLSRFNEDVSASQIFKVEYSIDGSTNVYRASNVELSTGTSIAVLKSTFPKNQPRQGHYLDITLSEVTQNTKPFYLNRMRLYGTIKEIQD